MIVKYYVRKKRCIYTQLEKYLRRLLMHSEMGRKGKGREERGEGITTDISPPR